MADKYASKQQPNREEKAANIMQARMSWPDAERYAAELSKAGVLESGDEVTATGILADHRSHDRAAAIVKDLIDYGAMEAKQ